jgi:hypothetical protein
MTSQLVRAERCIRPGARLCSRDVCARVRQELGERSDCGERGPLPPGQRSESMSQAKKTFTKRRPDTLLMGPAISEAWSGVVQCQKHQQQELTLEHKKTEASNRQQPPSRLSKMRLGLFAAFVQLRHSPAGETPYGLEHNGTDTDGELPPPADEKRSEQSEP